MNVIAETEQCRSFGEARADRSQLNPDELTAIELADPKHGLETLNYLFQRQNRFILHLPCSYETLANSRARPQFLEAIKSFAPELRRYIAFELHDLPTGVPQSRAIGAGDHAQSVRARRDRKRARATRWYHVGGAAADCSGTAVEPETVGLPETEIFARIGVFRERAHLAGDQMIAYGVSTKSLVMACWSMGLSHVSGAAIAPACSIPYQMSRFRPLDLYRA